MALRDTERDTRRELLVGGQDGSRHGGRAAARAGAGCRRRRGRGVVVAASLAGVVALSGCSTAGQGAFSGAALGSLAGLGLGSLSGNFNLNLRLSAAGLISGVSVPWFESLAANAKASAAASSGKRCVFTTSAICGSRPRSVAAASTSRPVAL